MLSRRIAILQRTLPTNTLDPDTTPIDMDVTDENGNTGSCTTNQGTGPANTDSRTKLDGDTNMATMANIQDTGPVNTFILTETGTMTKPYQTQDGPNNDNRESHPQQQQEGKLDEDGGNKLNIKAIPPGLLATREEPVILTKTVS